MFYKAFLLAMFATIGKLQLLLPFLEKIHFQKFITIIPIFGVLIDSKQLRQAKDCLRSSQGKLLIFLVFWMLMSVPFSIYPKYSLMYMAQEYWKTLVIIFLVIAYSSTLERFDNLIWIYIIANGLLCVWVLTASSGTRFSIMEDIYDPNDTALQFVMVLPFVLWKSMSSKGFKKAFLLSISLALMAGIIGTKSRGGFLGLVSILIVTLLHARHYKNNQIYKTLVPLLIIGGILFYYNSTEYMDRLTTILNPSEDYNITRPGGRIDLWKKGLDMMVNNPLLGVGIQCFISAEGILYGGRWNAAHNSFIQIGAELGIPGLVAFCMIIMTSMGHIRKIYLKHFEHEKAWASTARSIFGAWVGFVVSGFFLSAAYITPVYFLFALSIAFIKLHQDGQVEGSGFLNGRTIINGL